MTQMLPGLMQDDFPLTLHHIRRAHAHEQSRRARDHATPSLARGQSCDASPRCTQRIDRLARVLARLGIEQGDRVGDVRLEQPAPLRAVLRDPLRGRGAAHAQHPPVRGAAHLHRQPRRGQGDLRRRLARADAREARAELRDGRALRGDGRRRHGLAARTRCATRSCSRRPGRARSTTPSSTSARRRRSATRAARRATPRACSTRTARSACTRRRRSSRTASASAAPTACSRWCRCSTPTRGGCPTARRSPGADLILPDRFLGAEPLAELIAAERPTLMGCVPTIFADLLRYADEHPGGRSVLADERRPAAARRCRGS